jgi:phosphoribosylamine--glycine ligase
MIILVTGGGGREHAIVKKLLESPMKPTVYCAPGNGGIAADVQCFDVKATDIDGQAALAEELHADLVVIGPDDALALGLADKLKEKNIPAFGPDKAAARLESSKVFSKGLMKKYGIPTAGYEVFNSPEAARNYIETTPHFPTVIKADGLALGKGVIIAETKADALAAVTDMMENRKFGDSGSEIVIEEFMTGPEISVFTVTDGNDYIELSSAMDHKRAGDNDTGLNTGGMGTVAPNPFYTEAIRAEVTANIIKPTIAAMQAEGCPFSGVIYFGLMATPNGVKVIEYNSRFGDPEAQVILPLYPGDLAGLLYSAATGQLSKTHTPETKTDTFTPHPQMQKYAACVIIASGGYPEKYETGKVISGLDEKGAAKLSDNAENAEKAKNIIVFHAGTKAKDGEFQFLTAGGRVLGVTAVGDTQREAIETAYKAVSTITFDGAFSRSDIGKRALEG